MEKKFRKAGDDKSDFGRGRKKRTGKTGRTERGRRPKRFEKSDRVERSERPERFEKPDRAERSERPERSFKSDKPKKFQRSERFEKSARTDRYERPDKTERPGRSEHSQRSPKPDRSARGRSIANKGKSGQYKKSTKQKSKTPKSEYPMRLNRYLAMAGICSRREADTFIKSGVVAVNGKVVTEMGFKVGFRDTVKFNNESIVAEKKVYLILNKPKDYVTTTDDPHAKKTVMELVKHACKERIYPVGRLDRNTTGLLFFTNDGDIARRLMHPSFNKKKIYQVNLDKALTRNDMIQISDGIELDDGMINADSISYVDEGDKKNIGIEIHSGRNRIIRRIFEHLGYRVQKLDRVYYAGLTKKNLPRGRWRFLNEKEINLLKMNAFD